MDLPAARAILDYSRRRRRRRLLLLLAAAGFAGYGAYRLYHHPCVAERRRRLSSLLRAVASVAGALSRSAEAASLVSSDLSRFLSSDSNEIPNSLRQLSKIARSDDFVAALSRASEAVAAGVVRGATSGPASPSPPGSAADRVLDKVFSPAGTGFVSVVAGSFARNLVLGFYDSNCPVTTGGDAKPVPDWVRIMCSHEASKAMGEWIQTFVATAVEVYLRKTVDVNTYDEMFAGLTNPRHVERMKEVLVTVSKGAVETLVRTSHEVLTSSGPSASRAEGEVGLSRVEEVRKREEDVPPPENHLSYTTAGGDGGGGLLKAVSSTLAVPGNRRFMLDVTGRVTFETVKSVLDFTFWKMYDSTRSGMRSVGKEMAEMGMEVMRYASAKSMFILTVCFSMLLHLAFGSRLLSWLSERWLAKNSPTWMIFTKEQAHGQVHNNSC